MDLQSFVGPQQFAAQRLSMIVGFGFRNYEIPPDIGCLDNVNFYENWRILRRPQKRHLLPLIGKSPAQLSFDDLHMKHQNYAQIILDPAKVDLWFMKAS